MQIRAGMNISVTCYVTTPDGWPPLTADPAFVSGKSRQRTVSRGIPLTWPPSRWL